MGNYVFDFNGTAHLFSRDDADKDKYIVFACAKNEDSYIREWAEHYLNLGFDKIIIADNNDSPESLREILADFISNGTVQIFECNGLKKFQLYIYNMYLKEGNYKWCAYFDCDEFLELNIHHDIKEFLSGIEEHCVLINWIIFGSNGEIHKRDGKVQDRFKNPVAPIPFFKENFYVKPIIRGGEYHGEYLSNTHCPSYDYSLNHGGYCKVGYGSHVYYPPRYKYAYIKHYYTKSFDEWMSNKTKRGWPDEMFDILKPSNYFIIDKNPEFQIEKYTNGFFVDNNEFTEKKIHEKFDDVMSQYEMIELRASTNNIYALTLHLYSLMNCYKNHIFVIRNECVDDAMFGNFIEEAFRTENKVCFAFNDNDVNMAFWNTTTWNKMNYYYFDCQ